MKAIGRRITALQYPYSKWPGITDRCCCTQRVRKAECTNQQCFRPWFRQNLPKSNRSTAEKMLENGGLITEYLSGTIPDRENFPQRNRIVAGIAEATIVVEASMKGGALITRRNSKFIYRDRCKTDYFFAKKRIYRII